MGNIVKTAKDAYDQGYKEGYTDGIKQIRSAIVEFAGQASEALIGATEKAITDEKEG